MSYYSSPIQTSTSASRFFGSLGLAAVVTFGVFVMMHKLIDANMLAPTKPEEVPVIDLVFEPEDAKVNERQKIEPLPEPVTQPPRSVPDVPDDSNTDTTLFTVDIGAPELDVDPATMTGNFQGDQETRPVVRMQPKYPTAAARDGVEGWVILSFSIDKVGNVIDIEVVDAEPKRIFDREARRALAKWKYKPQLVDGQPVVRTGLEVQLDFSLQQ